LSDLGAGDCTADQCDHSNWERRPAPPPLAVADFLAATSQLAQTTRRSVLGKHELHELLAERDRLNADIQEILDQQAEALAAR
jgi:regulator of protease activity HflC (stomatin/prohibitin superfamily)